MKKIISLLLSAGMVFSLAGCKDGENKASTGKPVETVTIWTYRAHDKDLMTKVIDDFNNGKGAELGVKIDWVIKSDMTATMIDLGYESGQAPDMFETCNLLKLAEEGKIAAYEDLPGGPEYIAQFDGLLRETVNRVNGKTYTVINKFGVTTRALIYNKDMFKAAGIVDEKGEALPPKTIAQYREYAKKLTDKKNGKYGVILPMKWNQFFENDIRAIMQTKVGHLGYNPLTGYYEYESIIPVIDVYKGIKADGSYFPGAETLDNDSARARFAEGDIGMKMSASYDYGVLTSQFPAKCDWGVAPLPMIDEDCKYKQPYTFGYTPYINQALVDRIGGEKVMEIMKYLNSDDLAKKQYEEGKAIPLDSKIVDEVKLADGMENWKAFAELVSISAINPVSRKFDISQYKSIYDRFISEIWTDNGSSKALIDDFTGIVNKEIDEYEKNHPEYNGRQFILDSWDISRD